MRVARGLTQAQLAGDDFTKGFISQLETGTVGLSLRAAHVLSGRLGVSVADVIGESERSDHSQQQQLLQAEAELANGSPERALELLEAVRPTGPARSRFLRLRGRTLLALDRSRDALAPLTEALGELRRHGQLDLVGRTLYDIAHAHARLDETEEAIVAALECDRALISGDVIDRTLELEVRTLLASMYVRRGDFAAADLQIERATKLAQDVSNRNARAGLYANLAKTEQERGRFDQATRFWQRSLLELESLGQERGVAETWSNLAIVYRDRKMPREARDAISRAAEIAERTDHTRLRPYLDVTRAKLALDAGKHAVAEETATSVARDREAPSRMRVEALIVVGQILAARKAPIARIRANYERALALGSALPPGVRARILRLYADALERAGDLPGSLHRLRQALDLLRPIARV